MRGKLPSTDVLEGKIPDSDELDRLVENYPSFKWAHRDALLHGYFRGETLRDLVEAKLRTLNIDIGTRTPRSLGGHSRWVREKVNKTLVRILYLRYRIDDSLNRRAADQMLLKNFSSDRAKDAGQSAIRKMTEGAKIDRADASTSQNAYTESL